MAQCKFEAARRRARKLLEKWQDLGRDQSRARNRKVGFGDTSANTSIKEQIFREALARFDEQLAKIDEGTAAPASKSKSKKPMAKNRTAGHRTTRTAVRQDLKATKRGLNAPVVKKVESKQAPSAAVPAPSTASSSKAAASTPRVDHKENDACAASGRQSSPGPKAPDVERCLSREGATKSNRRSQEGAIDSKRQENSGARPRRRKRQARPGPSRWQEIVDHADRNVTILANSTTERLQAGKAFRETVPRAAHANGR